MDVKYTSRVQILLNGLLMGVQSKNYPTKHPLAIRARCARERESVIEREREKEREARNLYIYIYIYIYRERERERVRERA